MGDLRLIGGIYIGRAAILEAREWMALSPQQILLSALDLHRDPDVERGGRPWRALTTTKLEPGFVAPGDTFSIPDAPRKTP